MNFLVFLSCLLVVGVGYAHGGSYGLNFWNEIVTQLQLDDNNEFDCKVQNDLKTYFYSYCSNGKTMNDIPDILEHWPLVLVTFTKRVRDGKYLELLTYFGNQKLVDNRSSSTKYRSATIRLVSGDHGDILKQGVKNFIEKRKSVIPANLKSVYIIYEVINFEGEDDPYILAQIYGD